MAFPVVAVGRFAARGFLAGKLLRGEEAPVVGRNIGAINRPIKDVEFRVKGLKSLAKKLNKVELVMKQKIMKKALGAAIKLPYEDARSNVPYRTGQLRKSITTVVEVERVFFFQARLFVKNYRGKGTTNVADNGWYGRFVELGTKAYDQPAGGGRRGKPYTRGRPGDPFYGTRIHHPATSGQPFMRPAIDRNRRRMIAVVKKEIKRELRKAVRGPTV